MRCARVAGATLSLFFQTGQRKDSLDCSAVTPVLPSRFPFPVQLTNIKFAVAAGSRYESVSEKGAAHLLSVAAFAGTGKRSGLKLCRDLENLGATFSSSVDREKIVYHLSVASDKADEAVAAVAEAIAFPPSDSYVVGESKAAAAVVYDHVAASPAQQVTELLHDAAFGENTPLGGSLYAANLDKLDVDAVLAFRAAHFTAPRITVAASGGVSHDALKQMVECYLHSAPAGAASPVPASPYQGGELKVRKDLDGQTYLGLAFPVPAGADAAKVYGVVHSALAAKVASMDLPEGSSLSTFVAPYATGGIFGLHASGEPAAAASALEAGVAGLHAIAAGSAAVDGFKAKVHVDTVSALEGDGAAEVLLAASQRGVSASALADYKGVSAAAVSAAAAAALKSTPAYAVLGATYGIPSFAAITKAVNK